MQQDRWNRIETILDMALTLSGDERTTFINTACGEDNGLLQEVYEFLEAIEKSEQTQFLEGASSENAEFIEDLPDRSSTPDEENIGARIGTFEIVEKIGSGGMGAVYKAERVDGQFAQEVAIKLLQKSIQTEETLRRFRMEQEILASLKHPNIAQLYDGGVSDDGIPYLIMEYVDGMPIDEYCNNNELTVEDRIKLFKDVCKAVQFAHANLVIHRDLKAQNIYVTSEGIVKVLDFGIAKLLDPKLTEQTLLETRPGQKFWTPQYAAPEQVTGEAITTGTDVYALGVLLHRLLTNTYPLNLAHKDLLEIQRIITEDNPEKASVLFKESNELEIIVKDRKTTVPALEKTLQGDLDALILKSIRKEPEYRYPSVSQLLEDFERYDNGLPLGARKDSLNYRTSKFVRRHKTSLSLLSILLLALTGFSIFYTWSITQERNEANLQTEKAEKTAQFLTSLFNQSNPQHAQNADMTAREILDAGAATIFHQLGDQPEVRANVLTVIGRAYHNIEMFVKADSLISNALQIYRKLDGKHLAVDMAHAQLVMAQIKSDLGSFDEAEELARSALTTFRQTKGQDASETKESLLALSLILHRNGKFEEGMIVRDEWASKSPERNKQELASKLINEGQMAYVKRDHDTAIAKTREALRIRTAIFGEFHAFTAVVMQRLSALLIEGDIYNREAEVLQKRGLQISKTVYDELHTEWAYAMYTLAIIYRIKGNYVEAGKLYREAITMMEGIRGSKDPFTLNFKLKYAYFLVETDRLDAAQNFFQELEVVYTKLYGEEYLFGIECKQQVAVILKRKGFLNKSAKMYQEVISLYDSKYEGIHENSALARQYYGELLRIQERHREAEKWILESVNLLRKSKSRFKYKLAEAEQTLALLRMDQQRYEEAESLLKGSYEFFAETRGPKSNYTKESLANLIHLYEAWGKSEKVKEYQNVIAEANG